MTEQEKHQQERDKALVQHLYKAFEEQDIPAVLNVLAKDIDWLFHGPAEIPFAGQYRGHQGVAHFFATALETSTFLQFEPREFLLGSNRVLVQGYERGLAKSTGRIWETEWAHVFTIQGEKIVKMREYYDTAVIALAFREVD